MEWVETTGKSLEEATESALNALGVDAADAEVQVLEEARPGLFGRVRGEYRVKARVRPTTPRPKDGGRRRRGGSSAGTEGTETEGTAAQPAEVKDSNEPHAPSKAAETDDTTGDGDPAGVTAVKQQGCTEGGAPRSRRRRSRRGGRNDGSGNESATEEESVDGAALDQQAEQARVFMEGLVAAFGLQATASVRKIDDETREVNVEGGDLGLLIGSKGSTLAALQDLMRTAVQKGPDRYGRLLLDVAGYRHKRGAALARFSTQVAQDVLSSGSPAAMEPMSAADRKVVHDTVNAIDGVATSSEGEEPRRWVVIRPA